MIRKTILLSVTALLVTSGAANAGGFHFNLFAPAPLYVPAPVYVAPPRPVYVVEEYYHPVYRNPYPRYNFEHNYWYYDDYDGHRHRKHHKRHHKKHWKHHDDD